MYTLIDELDIRFTDAGGYNAHVYTDDGDVFTNLFTLDYNQEQGWLVEYDEMEAAEFIDWCEANGLDLDDAIDQLEARVAQEADWELDPPEPEDEEDADEAEDEEESSTHLDKLEAIYNQFFREQWVAAAA